MHVITGKFKGRSLLFNSDDKVRPTKAMVKEALISMFKSKIKDSEVLDLFCGSGAVAIEFISNDAKKAVVIDKDTQIVKKNINNLKIENKIEVYRNDAFLALKIIARKERKFDFIVLDPPYYQGMLNDLLLAITQFAILKPAGIIIVECPQNFDLSDDYLSLKKVKEKKYGLTKVVIYERK